MDMLKKLSRISYLGALILSLSACSDDMFNRPDAPDELPKGLSIRVPHAPSTRSGIEGNEDKISSLTLFAYPMDGQTEGNPFVYQLLSDDKVTATSVANAGNISSVSYDQYTISDFQQGNYKMYIVANLYSEASSTLTGKTSANLVKDLHDYTENHFKYSAVADNSSFTGIPMSCDHKDMHSVAATEDGQGNTTKFGTTNFEFKGSEAIYADLTFCLAKVTVSVEDAAGNDQTVTKAALSGHAAKFPVLSTDEPLTKASGSVSVENPTSTIRIDNENKELDGLKKYTFYVTENTFCSDSEHKLAMTFQDGSNSNAPKTEEITLGEERAGSSNLIQRGHHYDYLLSRDGAILLSVQEWDPVPLEAEINAPFELVLLDNPFIEELASGDEKGIPFTTDADPDRIKVVSPKITVNGNEINFYEGWIEDGRAMVKINTNIPLSTLQAIADSETETAKYNYYHIQANNLMKRIDIGRFKAAPVFTVYPEEITINVNEYFTSNDNTGLATIRFNTNLTGVKCNITSAKWVYADPDRSDELYSDVSSTIDGSIVFKFDRGTNGTAANGEDILRLGGLLDGQNFWTEKKELVVTYEVIDAPADWTDEQKKKTVTIKVRPFNSRYIIHFKTMNGEKWTNPHIYVYQCLEVPAGETNGGKTIGYSEGTSNTNAALEYCFTSDIAFKGFKGYGGSYEGKFTDYHDGFVWDANLSVKGNVSDPDKDEKKYKYLKMNTHHYEALAKHTRSCSYERCGSEYLDANRLWPGIVMYKEEKGDAAGWYTYELSGAATPGKALIMFTDDHASNSSTAQRFPGNDKVGVPLFDYEDKEGWFVLGGDSNGEDYINNRFYDDNPLKGTVTVFYKTTEDVYFNGWGGTADQKFIKMDKYPKDQSWRYITFAKDEYRSFVIRQYADWNNGTTEYIRKDPYSFTDSYMYFKDKGTTTERPNQ